MPSQRRQSFAPSATTSKSRGIGKKRARSFAPGEAARQLAPRKSILKSAFAFNVPKDAEGGEDTTMDFTADLTMGPGGFRKSLNKRVSFAVTKDIRIFEANDQNTNSSGGPPSSSPTPPSPDPPPVVQLSNENDYPGRRVSWMGGRRSSVGTDYGERSMSLEASEAPDSPVNPAFMFQGGGGGSSSDTEQDGDEMDMDMTQAMNQDIRRKRSLSIARRSSIAIGKLPAPSNAQDENEVSMEEGQSADMTTSSMESSREGDTHMEYTIPLEQPFREPKPPSEAWLQLQALTNSTSDTSTSSADDEGEDMELTDAITRLARARASFGIGDAQPGDGDPSFSSDESGMADDSADMANQTMNLTGLMGSVRDMDITGDTIAAFGQQLADLDNSIDSPPSSPPAAAPPPLFTSSVFSAPPPQPRSPSPSRQSELQSKSPSAPPLSRLKPPAVFVPPAPSGSTSPRRSVSPNPAPDSPSKKRPAESQIVDVEGTPKPSPAKKHAVGLGKSIPSSFNASPKKQSSTSTTPSSQDSVGTSAGTKTNSLRRPSGYFAQRRSLLPGGLSASASAPQLSSTTSTTLESNEKRRASIAVPQTKPSKLPRINDENVVPPSLRLKSVPAIVISDQSTTEDDDAQDIEQEFRTDEQMAIDSTPIPPTESQTGFEEAEYEEEVPPISIEEFFTMTGVKFMDQLTIPRRSTIRPSQLQQSTSGDEPLRLADYVTAMNVHVPQLELYSWVAKDLQTWIDNSKKIYREAEEEVAKVTPSLFREYVSAEEEGRSELLHQLKLIKANKHGASKEKWYEWKYEWTENLLRDAERGYAELQRDEQVLDDIVSQAEGLLPSLKQQHAQILLELERERSDVAEMEDSDPAYLEELKVTIDEQNALLDGYRADIAEGNAKVERLQEKLQELESQKAENEQVINDANRKITLHKNSTRAEVFRLKDELEALQALHSWRATKVAPNVLELLYDNQFLVSIPCTKYQPRLSELIISKSSVDSKPSKRRDPFPLLSELAESQSQMFASRLASGTVKQLVESLGDFWTSCAQIRNQLTFLSIKYPLVLEPLSSQTDCQGFKARATLLFQKQRAKATVSFIFNEELLARWPFKIRALECQVKVAYGAVDPELIHSAVMQRLSEASVEDNHACLLDACVEASSRYE
ncbi:Spc7-domain-containing protein [Schizopora paradoxa]|uniref:Spc7-domain-containing protein n=1 Tax=Schizopora paradoxa TaxID=27342 RepID=A0A0H2SF93_9AGAM|nr:Spc7-domain-containing protein [Schizopora paradoxa]